MKKSILSLLLILVMIYGAAGSVMAQQTTEDDALAVATNWITAIIAKKGSWGTSKTAEIEAITDFSRNGCQVGYFCKVSPKGFIVISLRKEMAPVKVYSATSDLNPLSEEGMVDLLKGNMERILTKVQEAERQNRKISGSSSSLDDLLEIDYRPAWESLERGNFKTLTAVPTPVTPQQTLGQVEALADNISSGEDGLNYQEGDVLLTSDWDQVAPYNNDCPDLDCDSPSNERALVGCVATAGAQIMRYWNWPPYGEGSSTSGGETVSHTDSYDWPNMPDDATTASPAAEQAAVAELSHEVGVAVGMNYGCSAGGSDDGGSWSNTSDMENVYQDHFRYSSTFNGSGAVVRHRSDYTATTWFNLMKAGFEMNRPVQYRIYKHSIVGDGWQTVATINQYHMNYGWTSAGTDVWYTVDTLTSGAAGDPLDPEGQEYLIEQIIPSTYLTSLSGTFPKENFRYRYFYRDTAGTNGIFRGGQYLQFLQEVVIECTGGTVKFENSTNNNTRLFSRGDLSHGIYMPYSATDAAIKLYPGGGIKIH